MVNEYNWFFGDIEKFAGLIAVVDADGRTISYADLCAEAAAFAGQVAEILPVNVERPLLAIEMSNDIEPYAAYVAAQRAHWPTILLAEGALEAERRIVETHRPNVIFRRLPGGWGLELYDRTPAAMHPDLAVLLSTSGTTGAPKLVRLSRRNIASNAEAIATYLDIGASDRPITTLAPHYSYGMSVLNSHLSRGAALVLTQFSVVDGAFWDQFERNGATSMALVPFQFDVLGKTGFDQRQLPTLRYVTQAGGKLPEGVARRFACLGRRDGWKLFLMYGQTEAAPRMAYVPPDDVESAGATIGRPVPGGRFEIVDADGRPVEGSEKPGELVYEGPNVMLGYAATRGELAAPAGPERLHTGDVALRQTDGYFRIVGRKSRFIKLFGLRIGLDDAEQMLRRNGIEAWCAGTDGVLAAFVTDAAKVDATRALIAELYGLPASVVGVEHIPSPPLLSSGKIDYRGLAQRAGALRTDRLVPPGDLVDVLALALRTDELDLKRSFSDHGGDSLSYLEVELCLAERLGDIPAGWERMPLDALLALGPRRRARPAAVLPVTPDLLLRVLALASIVLLHATSLSVAGGAYLLTALVGFSIARFQYRPLLEGRHGSFLIKNLSQILLLYYLIVATTSVMIQPVDWQFFVLMGNFDYDIQPDGFEPYWFVCLYAQLMLICMALFRSPAIVRLVKGREFCAGLAIGTALAACGLAVLATETNPPVLLRHPLFALLLVALGWCGYFAASIAERMWVTLLLVLSAIIFSIDGANPALMLLFGGLVLIWVPYILLPASAAILIRQVGSMALYVYMVHPIVIWLAVRSAARSELWLFLLALLGSLAGGWMAKHGVSMVMGRATATGRPTTVRSG